MSNFVPNGFFPEADQPWIPTLGDILTRQEDSESQFWNRVGWDNLEVPSDCPIVSQRMSILKTRFDERYFNRMLNAETLERWQVRLQNRFDEVVRRYERGYALYNQYQQEMMDDVLLGEQRTMTDSVINSGTDTRTISSSQGGSDSTSRTIAQGGSDSTDDQTRNIDTPDEAVNADDNYASSLSKKNSTVNYGRTDTDDGTVNYGKTENGTDSTSYGHRVTHTVTENKTQTGSALVDNINDSIDRWRDLDTAFVAEFENNFLNIWWY